ncbi:S8 family peptidase [Pseudarthrobacter sp. RMG13]|uniref:S8 family peptidase n=1 Tax=Pseudarthrobacter humi TaxID=2952523 RepID=A0ABT1LL20_9MICC|nr:S8 family peptidase [Pseudarthrobacter humi]MCP8999138.1 S8 family peptidase [Pseudarthrobacter humi]
MKYGNDVNAEAESTSLRQQGIEVKATLSHAMKASVVVATPKEMESLKRSEDVASVELDTPVAISGATSIWGLDRVDQRSGRDGQYSIGNEGAGVNIYVVDTGLHVSHTEFSGRIPAVWWGVHDGNGINDCNGHGTHVAGTAAGTTYGVAKKASIIPIRALECDGSGWASTIMAGIDWSVQHHVAGQPAVLNLSIGGFTNSSFDEAVQSAVNDGMTVVASAGNAGADACAASPARVRSAITVAATDINDAQASWSNYGSCVDIQAPGISIRSAWNNAATGYNTLDGTSMAAPHVSGAAAVLLSRDPSLSPAQVHQSMTNNAVTGVISANKGATPNRLLFIPAPNPPVPSCSNLQAGDAWAGVGTHCGSQGSAASTPSTAEAPPVTADQAPAPLATTNAAPAPAATAPAPGPAQPAPAQPAPEPADAPSWQAAAASPLHKPAAANAAQAAAIAEPGVISPQPVVDEATQRPETTSSETPATVAANSNPAPLPSGGATIAPAADAFDDAAAGFVTAAANNSFWVITIGLVLGGMAAAYAIRRLNHRRRLTV